MFLCWKDWFIWEENFDNIGEGAEIFLKIFLNRVEKIGSSAQMEGKASN